MKDYFLLLLFLFGTAGLFAQVTISGQVVDAADKAAIAYATVAVTTADGSMPGGGLSDDDGSFTVSLSQRGSVFLTVTFVGYAPQRKELFIGENNDVYQVGKISLSADAQVLEQVTVTGERSTIGGQLDKKSFDLSKQQAQGGGSVLDAMKALPGITVTQDGNVELRGSDRVAVLVDGKQSALTGYGNQRGLGSIPAANIERIEIITNPSAKYDAAGEAGIINIIYKQDDRTGFNGEAGPELRPG